MLSHAWVATPADVLEFVRHPRPELKKLGIRLSSTCQVETTFENHDWLAGRTHGLANGNAVKVFARGDGDGTRVYRVRFFASKKDKGGVDRPTLHRADEEERPSRRTTNSSRRRMEAQRRSMLASPLHLEVHKWLAPMTYEMPATKSTDEAQRIFAEIVRLVQATVDKSPVVANAMAQVADALQRPFHPAYTALFRAHSPAEERFHQTFVDTMHARALWVLETSGFHREQLIEDVDRLLADSKQTMQVLIDAIDQMDPQFAAHATVEAAIRRRDDPYFDAKLSDARRLFETLNRGSADDLINFRRPARRLERFESANEREWWFLPGLIDFAMGLWPSEPTPWPPKNEKPRRRKDA